MKPRAAEVLLRATFLPRATAVRATQLTEKLLANTCAAIFLTTNRYIRRTMAVALGKRKRVEAKAAAPVTKRPAKKEEPEESDSEDMRDAFRRAFEAKFKPLAGVTKKEKAPEPEEEDEEDESEDDDDWEGISENDEEPSKAVEVVEVTGPTRSERLSKAELKAFMVRAFSQLSASI